MTVLPLHDELRVPAREPNATEDELEQLRERVRFALHLLDHLAEHSLAQSEQQPASRAAWLNKRDSFIQAAQIVRAETGL